MCHFRNVQYACGQHHCRYDLISSCVNAANRRYFSDPGLSEYQRSLLYCEPTFPEARTKIENEVVVDPDEPCPYCGDPTIRPPRPPPRRLRWLPEARQQRVVPTMRMPDPRPQQQHSFIIFHQTPEAEVATVKGEGEIAEQAQKGTKSEEHVPAEEGDKIAHGD